MLIKRKASRVVNLIGFLIFLTNCSGSSNPPTAQNPASQANPPAQPPAPVVSVCAMNDATVVAEPAGWSSDLDFTATLALRQNVSGDLGGEIKFMQAGTVFPSRQPGERRALLTQNRGALLLYRPVADNLQSVQVIVDDGRGKQFVLDLAHPFEIPESDQNTVDGRPIVRYSKCSWTGEIPYDFILPGMSLTISASNQQTGSISASNFDVGPPNELVLLNYEIAMLADVNEIVNRHRWLTTSPRGRQRELAADYYQKIPVSKLIVAEYLPIELDEVVLANGVRYTNQSTDTSFDFFTGDLRDFVYTNIYTLGIQAANIGLSASSGAGIQITFGNAVSNNLSIPPFQPIELRPFRLSPVATPAGRYTDPVSGTSVLQRHCCTGGAGTVTVEMTRGNEISHEIGHDLSLPHYPGLIDSIHSIESGWSYDLAEKRMIGNLIWETPAQTANITDDFGRVDSRPAFRNLYTFNTDPMAGAVVSGNVSEFTHHTAYSGQLIQDALSIESGILEASSMTGFEIWNDNTKSYDTLPTSLPTAVETSEEVMTLVGVYDPEMTLNSFIYPPMYGNFGNVYDAADLVQAMPVIDGFSLRPNIGFSCFLRVQNNVGSVVDYPLTDVRLSFGLSNQFHINFKISDNFRAAEVFCPNGSGGGNVSLARRSLSPPPQPIPGLLTIGAENGF